MYVKNDAHFPLYIQKDLIRRLLNVVEALKDEDVEPNSPDYPGLAGLAAKLVEDGLFLEHRDKEVRLHSVLACMHLLEVVSNVESHVVGLSVIDCLYTQLFCNKHSLVCSRSSLRQCRTAQDFCSTHSTVGQSFSLYISKSSQL